MKKKKKREVKSTKSLKKNKSNQILKIIKSKSFKIFLRYLILLGFMFTLPIIYKIFTPLTIYPTAFLLKLLYTIQTQGDLIIINNATFIRIIPACVAGSAYLLLLIINLTVPMSLKKRINTLLVSFLILLGLNILRIFSLSILYHNSTPYFDFTHKLFWYGLSTVFVIAIWFYAAKLFSIKEIPVYSDFKLLMKGIKKK